MQPRALATHAREAVLAMLEEAEQDLVPAVARLSPSAAWYLCQALTRVQVGLAYGDGMGKQKQDMAAAYDSDGGPLAQLELTFGCSASGKHEPSRPLTTEEHFRLLMALAHAEAAERARKDIDEALALFCALPLDLQTWAVENIDPCESPEHEVGDRLAKILRAERAEWRELLRLGVR